MNADAMNKGAKEKEDKEVVVLYHANCLDGFGAALAAWLYYGSRAEYIAVSYNEEPPFDKLVGKQVFIVDFSYSAAAIREIAELAEDVVILDHHATAEAALVEFKKDTFGKLPYANVEAIFDMRRSGAMITWDYFNNGKPAPKLLQYIQDRDLWRKQLPQCDEVIAAIASYPKDFDVWYDFMHRTDILKEEGQAILRAQRVMIEQVVASSFLAKVCLGNGEYVTVRAANCPGFLASDVGHELDKGYPFSFTYCETAKGYGYSLRSRPEGFDVGHLAKCYGGGGHKNAAGCPTLVWYRIEEDK